tara:strand:+ start:482 stop:688 length:207 start_codon:yes stop_codon:yes gene_type:complete
VKLNPEEKLKEYLRRKYMMSKTHNDRITENADWKDGMDVFRLKVTGELIEINEKLDYIMKVLNEQNKK